MRNGKITINVGRDFSRFPGGRFYSGGPHSGEEFGFFITEILNTHKDCKVLIEMDGVFGYGSSFLNEMVRVLRTEENNTFNVYRDIIFSSSDEKLLVEIGIYLNEDFELRREQNQSRIASRASAKRKVSQLKINS